IPLGAIADVAERANGVAAYAAAGFWGDETIYHLAARHARTMPHAYAVRDRRRRLSVPEVKARYITWLASPLASASSAGPGNSPNVAASAGPTRQAQRRKSRSANLANTLWRSASAP